LSNPIQPTVKKISAAGLLITLAIFGDIGTSPLYVLQAIVGSKPIEPHIIMGSISCIFWTLTLQTSVKYVILMLKADNNGEGGIFALYTLLKRTKFKWLLVPAIIGGSVLLADGILTPSISIAAAVEGLRTISAKVPTKPIIIIILILLFVVQRFGTKVMIKLFGPVMLTWFLMLGILGAIQIAGHPEILSALNPVYAYNLLTEHYEGFYLLGAVFLCTTGAEVLYSDMGHAGKKNIRIGWIFVKLTLLLNYFGQAAWLIGESYTLPAGRNPFFEIMPDWFLIPGILLSICAAVIASQALINGSFTLINEAMRLNIWPKVDIEYPTNLREQLYIPSINWLLLAGCIGMVLWFGESAKMESAYGFSIIIGMIMSTLLFVHYMVFRRYNPVLIWLFIAVYATIEGSFLIANLDKFPHGGWVTFVIATLIAAVMWVWYKARKIKNRYLEFIRLDDYLSSLADLSRDTSIPKYATHLVYLTSANRVHDIESKVMYSIFEISPKRADIYWLIHVDVVDEPYTMQYSVNELSAEVIRIEFRLGFRVEPRIGLLFRMVIDDLVKNQQVDIASRYGSLREKNMTGDFRFVVIEKYLSYENDLPPFDKLILDGYFILKELSLSEETAFGLDSASVTLEKVPLFISPSEEEFKMKRLA
jgi:KUP system potassium uptake protein